jgi:hypothetical protein
VAFILSGMIVLFSLKSISIDPHMFTYAIFALEIYLLEKFIRTKKREYLYILPVLAMIVSNVNVSFSIMFVATMVPYLVEMCFEFEFERVYSKKFENAKEIKWTTSIFFVSMICLMVRPYLMQTIDYVKFLLTVDLNSLVIEMKMLNYFDHSQYILTIAIGILIYAFSKKSIPFRVVLMILGVLITTMMSLSYYPYLVIVLAIYSVEHLEAYYKSICRWNINETLVFKKIISLWNTSGVNASILLIVIGIAGSVIYVTPLEFRMYPRSFPIKAVDFIKKNVDTKNMRMMNDYKEGSYMIYHDLKVLSDSRVYPYLPEYSKKNRILYDLAMLRKFPNYFRYILTHYGITHGIANKSRMFYYVMETYEDKNVLYEDEYYKVYEFK